MKLFTNYLKNSCLGLIKPLLLYLENVQKNLQFGTGSFLVFPSTKVFQQVTMILLLCATGSTWAQNVAIEGTVSDETGPLPGVNVIVKGTFTGTISDIDGAYSLDAQIGETLVYSFLGYKSQEIIVETNDPLDITLEFSTSTLGEIVMIGYGAKKKVSLTSAVSSIGSDEILTTSNENVQNMLTGKIAGLRVIQNSSEPGSFDNSIDIRGLGNPLIIIDGIPRENMSRLNPDDIESVSVLKDASAAIYGVRAANGVILITTKKGTPGKMELNYTGTYGIQVPSGMPETVGAIDYMTLVNESTMHNVNGGRLVYTEEDFDAFKNGTRTSTNWYNEVMRDAAPQTQHSLSASGGSEKIKYFFSTGYTYQESIIKSDDLNYERFNIRSNISAELAKGLTMSLNLSGTMDEKEQPFEAAWWIIRSMWYQPPTEMPYANGNPDYLSNVLGGLNPVSQSNADVNGYQNFNNKWFQSSLSLDYDVPFVEGLNVKALYSYDYQISVNKQFRKEYNQYTYNAENDSYNAHVNNAPSRIRRSFYEYPDNLARISLDYDRTFGDHKLTGLLLYEQSTESADNFYAQRDLSIPVDQLIAGNSEDQEGYMSVNNLYKFANKAVVGRLTYDYRSKYLAEFSFRQDGSSKFSKDKQWGLFPAVSLGWRFSEENFWKNSPLSFINNFKLRGSYGRTGDDSASNYQFITGYNYPASGSNNGLPPGSVFGNTFVNAIQSKGLPNPDITWYTSDMYDIGVDLEAWDGLFGFTFDYFARIRDGLLANRGLSFPDVVGTSLPQENLNGDRTSGFDMEFSHLNTIGDFHYNIKGTFGFTRTENTHIEQAEAGNSYLNWLHNQSNRNQGVYWGYGSSGRYENYGDIVNSPTYVGRNVVVGDYNYMDWNGDGTNNSLDSHPIAYTGRPMITFGTNLNGTYKKLDFNLLFQGAAKTEVAYFEQLNNPLWAGGAPLTQFVDRYHPVDPTADPYDPNTEWVTGRFAYTGTVPYTNTSINVQDASYVRLKSVEVGYSFNDNIRVFVNGYNLLTWTDLKYLDPEHPSSTYGYLYPLNKKFAVGINFKL